jgi:ribosome-associated heat shock protein Hsp15
MNGENSPDACRIDVWLWRARFFKTRSLACRFVEEGRVRLHRDGAEVRLDKPSRNVRPGDAVVFAIGGRIVSVRIEGLGERRGPASEARGLYSELG